MAAASGRIRRLWAVLVGPEATAGNTVTTIAVAAAGSVGAGYVARRRGPGRAAAGVTVLLAGDLVGGAYVNNTRACARWYERPEQGTGAHVVFAAAHVHPAVIAHQDRDLGQESRVGWALATYAYMMLATGVIRCFPTRRRWLGMALTAGGLVLDRGLGPSVVAPWFAWAYHPKLLMGHAAAALWRDSDLGKG